MSTISYALVATETTKRHRREVMSAAASLADIEFSTASKTQLERGESVTVTPTKLFCCSSNGVNILIRITVNGVLLVLPLTSWLSIPFDAEDTVSIQILNPSDNTVLLPAEVSYFTV